jgi:osmotically-inducible protein OsmY
MNTAILTPSDVDIRKAVLRRLECDADADVRSIAATAHAGAVTLTGLVDSYAAKLTAERAALHIHGVRAVANDIQIRTRFFRSDDEIAYEAARALALRPSIPETVQATVHQGHVTLTGRVPIPFHSVAAEWAIRPLAGVIGVINRIEVVPEAQPVTAGASSVCEIR